MDYMYVADNGDLHSVEFAWVDDVLVVISDDSVDL